MMYTDAVIDAIRALARGEQPPFDISEILYRHRCFYWLNALTVPTVYTRKAREAQTLHRIALRERYRTCAPLFDSLEHAGVPYAVIKGAPLALAAYGDEGMRFSSDIDLLIARADSDMLGAAAREQGFVHGRITPQGAHVFSRQEQLFYAAMTHQIAPYIKRTGNPLCPHINVDINVDLMWGESTRKLDPALALRYTRTVMIGGTAVRVLSDEAAFIQLCLHHYKDMNSLVLLTNGKLRLSLFCDIYYVVKRSAPNRKRLAALCDEWGVSPYVAYCLHYTHALFPDPALRELYEAIGAHCADALLNSYGLTDSERREWDIPFPERLFCDSLAAHIRERASATELAKLDTNHHYL